MKKIVPFKKDIIFKTNLSEIISISLEHSLHLEKNSLITGEFIISGEYKMADTSIDTENFSFNLPFDINVDERYILDNITVDIDDFYYEIVNNNVLSVNIEILIDKLEEKPVVEQKVIIDVQDEKEEIDVVEEPVRNAEIAKKEITESQIVTEKKTMDSEVVTKKESIEQTSNERNISDEQIQDDIVSVREEIEARPIINSEAISTIFDDFDESRETYATYQVYIVRENDSLETILQKYCIGKEALEQYNDLKELKIGDKLIIPQTNVQNQ